jgi:hypothetical protein
MLDALRKVRPLTEREQDFALMVLRHVLAAALDEKERKEKRKKERKEGKPPTPKRQPIPSKRELERDYYIVSNVAFFLKLEPKPDITDVFAGVHIRPCDNVESA